MNLPPWTYAALKIGLTALIIYSVSEIAKRSTVVAALAASLPLTSLLAIVWMHAEGSDVRAIADLAASILWMVVPSLAFFMALPALLRRDVPFWPSLGLASLVTVGAYALFFKLLARLGVAA